MTCTTVGNRTWPEGNEEFLEYEVTANVELDAQTVEITLDRVTYLEAEWIGDPGNTRSCRTVLPVTNANLPGPQAFEVFIRITDTPEVPLFLAETINVI